MRIKESLIKNEIFHDIKQFQTIVNCFENTFEKERALADSYIKLGKTIEIYIDFIEKQEEENKK